MRGGSAQLGHGAVGRRPRWLVLVDDDSMVNAELLLSKLGGLNHSRPLFAGDFAGACSLAVQNTCCVSRL
eukprot:4965372-Prymnesium_polylepis.1